DGQVRFWRAPDGAPLPGGVKHPAAVLALAWSPNGWAVASAGGEKAVRLWDARAGRELPARVGHQLDVAGLAWSPDSQTLASAGTDRQIRLWVFAGKGDHTITAEAPVTALAWARPTGELAAATNKGVTVYDGNRQVAGRHEMQSGVIWAMAWSPDG